MLPGPRARDEQDIWCQFEQPRERDLRGSGGQPSSYFDQDWACEDRVLDAAWPTQREERYERDGLRGALFQDVERALVHEVEQVLHANDLRLTVSSVQVLSRYVAQADPVDQP